MAGSHVVAVAANDARVKAGVAIAAVEAGKGVERKSFSPDAALLASMVILARTGQAPATEAAATAMNREEQKIALSEYQPFRYADQIPKDTAMLFLDGKTDAINAAADFLAKSLTKTQ